MVKNQRTPYRFKTIYELYLEFKQRFITSEGLGSTFLYSKNLLEAQEETAELKMKFRRMAGQISQLKEEISSKDHAILNENMN